MSPPGPMAKPQPVVPQSPLAPAAGGPSIALDAADARALTDRIKLAVEATWELVKQAHVKRAWEALGYTSWDEYCAREFGTSRLRLPREERAEVVASLRESGLSIRAIASATGLNKDTVNNVTRELSGNRTPGPAPVIGSDGKTYSPRSRKPLPEREIDRRIDEHESTGLCQRWLFGRELLAMRDDRGRLPKGVISELVKLTGKSRSELRFREQFAAAYPTADELRTAIAQFGCWDRVVEHLKASMRGLQLAS
jgi:transposase-like protein